MTLPNLKIGDWVKPTDDFLESELAKEHPVTVSKIKNEAGRVEKVYGLTCDVIFNGEKVVMSLENLEKTISPAERKRIFEDTFGKDAQTSNWYRISKCYSTNMK